MICGINYNKLMWRNKNVFFELSSIYKFFIIVLIIMNVIDTALGVVIY